MEYGPRVQDKPKNASCNQTEGNAASRRKRAKVWMEVRKTNHAGLFSKYPAPWENRHLLSPFSMRYGHEFPGQERKFSPGIGGEEKGDYYHLFLIS